MDSVDALLFWINKICLLVRDDIEKSQLTTKREENQCNFHSNFIIICYIFYQQHQTSKRFISCLSHVQLTVFYAFYVGFFDILVKFIFLVDLLQHLP